MLVKIAITPVLHLYMKSETVQIDELSNMPDNDEQIKNQIPADVQVTPINHLIVACWQISRDTKHSFLCFLQQ